MANYGNAKTQVNICIYHLEVSLKYMMLELCYDCGTMRLVII